MSSNRFSPGTAQRIPPAFECQMTCGFRTSVATFDTTGTTLRRAGNVFTITCEDGDAANRVADQLRSGPPDWQNAKVSIDLDTRFDGDGLRVFGRVVDWQPEDYEVGGAGEPIGLRLLCEYESDNFGMCRPDNAIPVAWITKAGLAKFKNGADPEKHVLLRSGNGMRVALYAEPCGPGVAQAVPSLTDAMIEAGARVAALRRGHKNCDELVTTTNAGKQPVWKFYTEEPRAILEAVFNAAPPSNQGASK